MAYVDSKLDAALDYSWILPLGTTFWDGIKIIETRLKYLALCRTGVAIKQSFLRR